jgi:hypothetical protein
VFVFSSHTELQRWYIKIGISSDNAAAKQPKADPAQAALPCYPKRLFSPGRQPEKIHTDFIRPSSSIPLISLSILSSPPMHIKETPEMFFPQSVVSRHCSLLPVLPIPESTENGDKKSCHALPPALYQAGNTALNCSACRDLPI